jgi:cytochrome P450
MATVDAKLLGEMLVLPESWGDLERWQAVVGDARRRARAVPIEVDGFQPFLALLHHSDVLAVSRDNDTWHNTSRSVLQPDVQYQAMVDAGIPEPRTLVHLDGIEHRDHRLVANDWFKPAAVRHRAGRIDALAQEFVGRLGDLGGACDLATDIAKPFTLRVIMDLYGVPESDEPLMLELTQGLFGAGDPEFMGDAADPRASLIASVSRFIEYFTALTEDRRAHPADDLATVIATGRPGGEPMGDAERLWYYIIVATAGHDTTSFALAGALERMAHDPGQLWAVRDDPSLAVNAAEETIRYTSPVRHFLRYATRETAVAGQVVPNGGCVLLSYPSANRDEEVFTDPDRFDVRRGDADRHLAFGSGAHFCLGAQVARMEIRTMLLALARRLEHIEPAGRPQWARSGFVSGVKHLPVRYRMRAG